MNFRILASPTTAVWALLVLATLLTGWLAETHAGLHWVAIVIILIASTKIGLVMSEFMELRTAPVVWRLVMGSGCWSSPAWFCPGTCLVETRHVLTVSGWCSPVDRFGRRQPGDRPNLTPTGHQQCRVGFHRKS
jgi:hypothetical protein